MTKSYWKFGSKYAGITSRGKRFVVDTAKEARQKAGISSKSKTSKKGGTKKTGNNRRQFTIPFLPVMGVIGAFVPTFQSIADGNWGDAFNYMSEVFVAWSPGAKRFIPQRLLWGWGPILAGLLGHKVMSLLGANRVLGQARVPIFRL